MKGALKSTFHRFTPDRQEKHFLVGRGFVARWVLGEAFMERHIRIKMLECTLCHFGDIALPSRWQYSAKTLHYLGNLGKAIHSRRFTHDSFQPIPGFVSCHDWWFPAVNPEEVKGWKGIIYSPFTLGSWLSVRWECVTGVNPFRRYNNDTDNLKDICTLDLIAVMLP